MVHRDHPHLALIVSGASIMAMIAGYVNAMSIHFGGPVSGVTGVTTNVGLAWGEQRNGVAGLLLLLQVFCFLLGSALGGFIAPSRRMRMEVPYGFALIVESVFLAAGTVLLWAGYSLEARFPLSFGMGLQNGLATYYSNAVMRLTHITGMVSDIGMLLGESLRRHQVTADLWKLRVYVPICAAFLIGALLGGMYSYNPLFMLVPTLLCFFLGFGYLTGRLVFVQVELRKVRVAMSPLQILFPPPPPEESEADDATEEVDHLPLQVMSGNIKREQSQWIDRQLDGEYADESLSVQFSETAVPVAVEPRHAPVPARRVMSYVVVAEDERTKARRIQSTPFL
jgi:uncharacterized membrane protein YoaK (UPF0700 family)